MLEHPALLIGPPRDGPQGPYRSIRNPANGDVLGHCFRQPTSAPAWLASLWPQSHAICETPDGSLLCVCRRAWGWGELTIEDAERNPLAILRSKALLTPTRMLIAHVVFTGSDGQFRDGHHEELAHWFGKAEGVELRFELRLENEPFLKMALLATSLHIT